MFGDPAAHQKKLAETLSQITVESEAGDGAVQVKVNGLGYLTEVHIDKERIDVADTEALEDLLLVAVNRALEEAGELKEVETTKLIKEMMPPGLENMF